MNTKEEIKNLKKKTEDNKYRIQRLILDLAEENEEKNRNKELGFYLISGIVIGIGIGGFIVTLLI